jgi:hypothetical protein
VFIPHGFGGYTNFFLPTALPLVPGTTYYFQPFVRSGDSDNNMNIGLTTLARYTNGVAFLNGAPSSFNLLFREGNLVPEPSAGLLLLLGVGGLYSILRRGKTSERSSIKVEQVLHVRSKRLCQKNDFSIGDATDLSFDFCNRIFRDIPTGPATSSRKHGLRNATLIADFSDNRADDIFRSSLAHFGLDAIRQSSSISSEIGRLLETPIL